MEINKELISKLKESGNKEDAFFSFCYDEKDQDNEHIKANREGLIQFALFLLRIAVGLQAKNLNSEKNLYSIDKTLALPQEGIPMYYVELLDNKKSEFKPEPESKENWKEKLIIFGCVVFLGLLIFCGMVGIYTVINWIG